MLNLPAMHAQADADAYQHERVAVGRDVGQHVEMTVDLHAGEIGCDGSDRA